MNDLNFNVRSGEIEVLMGASGCGKSTLIGLETARKGKVYYGNHELNPKIKFD